MARRQKGPTTEELLQKLDTRFTEYQAANDEAVEKFKDETKETIERLDNDSKDSSNSINSQISSLQAEMQKDRDLFEEKHSKTFNETQESLNNLETKLQELENGLKSVNEKFDTTVENIDSKLENNKEEMSTNMTENNNKLCESMDGIKAELRGDIENIFKVVQENQEDNKNKIDEINQTLSNLNELMQSKMEENFHLLLSRMENDAKNTESIKDGQDVEMTALKEEVSAMIARVDDISEKMYEFEQNKKNNLLFYGIGRHVSDV